MENGTLVYTDNYQLRFEEREEDEFKTFFTKWSLVELPKLRQMECVGCNTTYPIIPNIVLGKRIMCNRIMCNGKEITKCPYCS